MMTLRPLTLADVTIEVEALPEDLDAYEHLGECMTHTEIAKLLVRSYDVTQWAWCCVKVTVSWRGWMSDAEYLGACSYESKEDFVKPGDYYDDMVRAALANLNEQIAADHVTLSTLAVESKGALPCLRSPFPASLAFAVLPRPPGLCAPTL